MDIEVAQNYSDLKKKKKKERNITEQQRQYFINILQNIQIESIKMISRVAF